MVFTALHRLKYVMYHSPSLDNFIYKLCYRWTVLVLVAFSFIITCKLLFGDSFECAETIDLPQSYVNAKCYADATYTLPGKLFYSSTVDPVIESFRRYQTYYSWVNLFFLVQAFLFYLPHLLWESYEGGYMYRLTSGVQKFFDKEEKRGLELCYLAKYVLVTQGKHKWYTRLYIFFESMNYSTALAQTLSLIYFFDVTGVPDFLKFSLVTWSDFKHFYFPPAGFCNIKTDSLLKPIMCEMPINGLYMKMFLFLHAWYILITIMTGMVLIYRIALLVPSFRVFAAKSSTCLSERSVLKSLCYRMSYSDWFFMTRMQKTMTDIDFAQMIDKIAIVSQGLDKQKSEDRRSSLFEDGMKDFESSGATSPV